MHPISEKWEEIKQIVKKEYGISEVSYKTWIMPLKIHSVEDNIVKIVIPSDQAHIVDYLTNKYKIYFQVSISEMFDNDYEVSFLLEKDIKGNEDNSDEKIIYNINYSNANLNAKYNFDTFVVGNNNKFAHSAALAVAESPGEVYNPLFVYGNAGLGKTHLMHSIGHFILEHNSNTKVLYVSSEQFTNEVIDCIRSGNAVSMSNLREKYRNIDVLLLDDVQFIIGKERTQEEFFNTFNALHTAGKQIILSSDKPPKEMTTLDERYRSRFEWGLIADIQSPDYETRMAILQKNVELSDRDVDIEILKYIATNVKSNIRELEGALKKVIAFSKLNNTDLTLAVAEDALKDIIYPQTKKQITPQLIMEVVANHFDVQTSDIASTKRNAEYVYPRQIFMYLCREMIDIPFKSIGNMIGKKDHSTVMHGVDKIKKELENNDELRNTIEIIKNQLKM